MHEGTSDSQAVQISSTVEEKYASSSSRSRNSGRVLQGSQSAWLGHTENRLFITHIMRPAISLMQPALPTPLTPPPTNRRGVPAAAPVKMHCFLRPNRRRAITATSLCRHRCLRREIWFLSKQQTQRRRPQGVCCCLPHRSGSPPQVSRHPRSNLYPLAFLRSTDTL